MMIGRLGDRCAQSPPRGSCARGWLLALALLAALTRPAAGEVFRLLDDDREAWQARCDLLHDARSSILIATYAIGDDQSSAGTLEMLRAAAARGVQVRILVDALRNEVPAVVQRELLRQGVDIREYHPFELRHVHEWSERLHDKLLVVDGRWLIIGSRNFRDSHFGLEEINYVDRDVLLSGEVAGHAEEYFQRLWDSAEVQPTSLERRRRGRATPRPTSMTTLLLDFAKRKPEADDAQRVAWTLQTSLVQLADRTPAAGGSVAWFAQAALRAPAMRFLCDPVDDKDHEQATARQVAQLLDSAQTSLLLESPYFVLSSDLQRSLEAALERNVRVTIVTNSLASTDQTMVYAAYANGRSWLLKHGVELWEYRGPNWLHAKSAVIDDRLALIGSYNFDPRSEDLNTESLVLVDDPQAAALLTASIAAHQADSDRIGRDGRAEGATQSYQGASTERVLQMQIRRPLAWLLRKQL